MAMALLDEALKHFKRLLETRLDHYFAGDGVVQIDSVLGDLWRTLSQIPAFLPFDPYEQAILIAALAPHLKPNLYESALQSHIPQGGEFIEFGGSKSGNHRGMIPTGDTILFILAADDLERRIQLQHLFGENQPFSQRDILTLETVKDGEPPMSGRLILQASWREKVLFGKEQKPRFGPDFPAHLLTTGMEWDDVVLNPHTRAQIDHMQIWLRYNTQLMDDWNMGRKIKPGYRALFYGPPGTGKTLTATLLGKQFQKDVYRIDLSQVVSKYIGETEKNLEKIFAKGEHKDRILFFDEADALFGKRSPVQHAQDRYANQEVSYLLQRVEDHPGIIILASNFKNNLDAAFLRRFNALISFPLPNVDERVQLWSRAVPQKMTVPFDWKEIAQKYEMSGSSIMNVMHFAALRALSQNRSDLLRTDIIDGIRDEYSKDDKFF